MDKQIIRIDLTGVNAYLVKAGTSFVLFDTGGPMVLDKIPDNRREKLVAALEQAGCNQNNLKLLVITHGDYDHTYNAAWIQKQYQIAIAMHPADLPLTNHPDTQTALGNFQYRSGLPKLAAKFIKKLFLKKNDQILHGYPSFTPDILIDENFDFTPYGFKAKVICIPGHTLGSIAILFPDGDLICGDTFNNSANTRPQAVTNARDFSQLDSSIKKLGNYNITAVYPGHGNIFQYSALPEI